MRKLLILLIVFFGLTIAFSTAFAKETQVPIFLKVVDYGDFYSYEFEDGEVIYANEVTVQHGNVEVTITSTEKLITMTMFNFTSTFTTTVKGTSSTIDITADGFPIISSQSFIIIYNYVKRLLLPLAFYPTS